MTAHDETARSAADVVLLAGHDGELHVLLIQRGHPPFEGHFALPGGHVDPGEYAEDAARRELAEETGIQAASLDLVGVYDKPGRDPRGAYSTTAYVGLLDHAAEPTAGDDADVAGWFPLSTALSVMDLAFDHDQILADAAACVGEHVK